MNGEDNKAVLEKYGSVIYAVWIIRAELLLFVYWVVVLAYLSTQNRLAVEGAILFAFHFASLIALCALLESMKIERLRRYEIRRRSLFKINSGGSASAAYGTVELAVDEPVEDNNTVADQVFPTTLRRFPLEWGISVVVATTSDLFTVINLIILKATGDTTDPKLLDNTTFSLFTVLFSLGLTVNIISLVWILVVYFEETSADVDPYNRRRPMWKKCKSPWPKCCYAGKGRRRKGFCCCF